MENKLLQPLLQAGLLDIGDSDERLANIEKSIADLEAKLKKEQSLLPAYTLVGLDPNINPDEPVLAEVEAIIATHWKALRAKFSETPVPIIRAVILHALYNVGTGDVKNARIIHLTATNFYPYAKLGREKEIVETIITDLGELAEENASEEWSLIEEEPKLKLGTLKLGDFKFDEIKFDGKVFSKKFDEAFTKAPSGHGPQHGMHESNYQTHFKAKTTEAISESFNSAFDNLNKSLNSLAIEEPINKFFAVFKKSLDENLKISFASIHAVERRSKLLWWKETLYSSSLKDSYRSINETVQPIIMAKDLYQQLPDIVPVSVDYLLRDTLLLLNGKANEKIQFSEVLEEISKDANKNILKEYFKDIDVVSKRISITDFIKLVTHGKVQASSLKQYTGIEDNEEVSLTDIAVMILHDLMAEYLIPKSK
ncbi:GTPase-associated system all-helical protein GASH [Olivibacter oleidegradans]|uniref:GTPase-associated system all-helical protein GASH n=1 Tax=Olivibacter oleidegradans TaxID=760123 RepID=A0ABV6HPA0_9SPHI